MRLSTFIVILCAIVVVVPVWATPRLQSDSERATAGYFRLSWTSEAKDIYVLQEAGDPEFLSAKTLYQGPDTATIISGRGNGTYYYRVRAKHQEDQWSDFTSVAVEHHSLTRALVFFALGAIVFTVTLTTVVLGSKSQKQ